MKVNFVQIVRLKCSEVRTLIRLGDDADRKEVGKLLNSHWREKPLGSVSHLYRKPTQVGEERILR